jgi:hypothetical protein
MVAQVSEAEVSGLRILADAAPQSPPGLRLVEDKTIHIVKGSTSHDILSNLECVVRQVCYHSFYASKADETYRLEWRFLAADEEVPAAFNKPTALELLAFVQQFPQHCTEYEPIRPKDLVREDTAGLFSLQWEIIQGTAVLREIWLLRCSKEAYKNIRYLVVKRI